MHPQRLAGTGPADRTGPEGAALAGWAMANAPVGARGTT